MRQPLTVALLTTTLAVTASAAFAHDDRSTTRNKLAAFLSRAAEKGPEDFLMYPYFTSDVG